MAGVTDREPDPNAAETPDVEATTPTDGFAALELDRGCSTRSRPLATRSPLPSSVRRSRPCSPAGTCWQRLRPGPARRRLSPCPPSSAYRSALPIGMRWRAGRAKAAVLPVPVGASANRSRPRAGRDRLTLDGSRLLVAEGRDRVEQPRIQLERCEPVGGCRGLDVRLSAAFGSGSRSVTPPLSSTRRRSVGPADGLQMIVRTRRVPPASVRTVAAGMTPATRRSIVASSPV